MEDHRNIETLRANKKKREQERERETDRENRGKIKKGDSAHTCKQEKATGE